MNFYVLILSYACSTDTHELIDSYSNHKAMPCLVLLSNQLSAAM